MLVFRVYSVGNKALNLWREFAAEGKVQSLYRHVSQTKRLYVLNGMYNSLPFPLAAEILSGLGTGRFRAA